MLLGFVIAAAEGLSTWQEVNQSAVLANASVQLHCDDTVFPKNGRCSVHHTIAHQYALIGAGQAKLRVGANNRIARHSVESLVTSVQRLTRSSVNPPQCTPRNWSTGISVAYGQSTWPVQASTVEECCAVCNTMPLALYGSAWTFHSSNGSCVLTFADDDTGRRVADASSITGVIQAPALSEDMFADIREDSCLNGWTMGNIATTPRDIARFIWWLFAGRVVPQQWLNEMTQWKYITRGWAKCAPDAPQPEITCMGYGLGLMRNPHAFPVIDPTDCDRSPGDCVCFPTSAANRTCYAILIEHGHLGEDWGSAMQVAGLFPRLNVSLVLGTNSASGMNFTGVSLGAWVGVSC